MDKRFAAGSSWEREKAVSRSMLYKTPAGESIVMAIYDAALQSWPVPCQTQMVSTRYGETFVIASGNPLAPPIILLHGAGGNSAMWAGDVEGYSSQFRVYAVDLPGEAGKSTSNRPTWDSPAFAEWLEDVLNGLRIKHVTFVGISQGAWAALKFAVVNPERVRKLALIAPAGIVPDRLSFLPTAIVLSLFGKWGVKRLVRRLLGDQNSPGSVIETVAEITAHFKPRIGVLPLFTEDELRRLTMPTLLLGGTKDICRDTVKIGARMQSLVPYLTVQFIAGAGHIVLNTSAGVIRFLVEP